MNHLTTIKNHVAVSVGIIGGVISKAIGGWDSALQILVIFMAIDYLTGLLVAGVFKKSKKSKTGALESYAGFKGLCRKGMALLMVLVAHKLDLMTGTDIVRDAVIIAYIVNETISIVENAGAMGAPVPPIVQKAIETLQRKGQ